MKCVIFGAVASLVVVRSQRQVVREGGSGDFDALALPGVDIDEGNDESPDAKNEGNRRDGRDLSSKCEDGSLIISIPHPDEKTASLLFLNAGTCDQDNFQGAISYDRQTKRAEVSQSVKKA